MNRAGVALAIDTARGAVVTVKATGEAIASFAGSTGAVAGEFVRVAGSLALLALEVMGEAAITRIRTKRLTIVDHRTRRT